MQATSNTRVTPTQLVANPANFLALGAGSGLSPLAPGTVGTVAAIPLLLLMPNSLLFYLAITALLFVIGVWCCGACATHLGVHDHHAIVWDEVVGLLVTMIAVPRTWWFVLLGFLLFRVFDVLKPWPISWVDARVHGGLGIMLDDIIAGVFAAVVLHMVMRVPLGLG